MDKDQRSFFSFSLFSWKKMLLICPNIECFRNSLHFVCPIWEVSCGWSCVDKLTQTHKEKYPHKNMVRKKKLKCYFCPWVKDR